MSLKKLFKRCKNQNSLGCFVNELDRVKMSNLFTDCKNKKDYSSIVAILEQLATSSVYFEQDLLLFIIQEFNKTTEVIIENIF